MKKISILSLVAIVMVTIPLFTFTSCGGDDDEDNGISFTSDLVVGGWQIISTSTSDDDFKVGNDAKFYSDGACRGFFSMEDSYEIKNGKVYTYYARTKEPMYVYTLLSVTESNGTTAMSIRVDGTLDDHSSFTIKVERYDVLANTYNYFDEPLLMFDSDINYIKAHEKHTFVEEREWEGINGNRYETGRDPYLLEYKYTIQGSTMTVRYYFTDKAAAGIHHIDAIFPIGMTTWVMLQLTERYGNSSTGGSAIMYYSKDKGVRVDLYSSGNYGRIEYYSSL